MIMLSRVDTELEKEVAATDPHGMDDERGRLSRILPRVVLENLRRIIWVEMGGTDCRAELEENLQHENITSYLMVGETTNLEIIKIKKMAG